MTFIFETGEEYIAEHCKKCGAELYFSDEKELGVCQVCRQ